MNIRDVQNAQAVEREYPEIQKSFRVLHEALRLYRDTFLQEANALRGASSERYALVMKAQSVLDIGVSNDFSMLGL